MTKVRVLRKWAYESEHYDVGTVLEVKDEVVAASVACGLVEVVGDVEEAEPTSGATNLEALLDKWELDTAPAAYLKKFPEGPHAALAKAIIEADEASEPEN